MSAVLQRIETPNSRTTVLLPFNFDWSKPDYPAVFAHRLRWLAHLQQHPQKFEPLLKFYRTGNGHLASGCAQFLTDWGCTFDPRNPERGLPSMVPFILFPKQVEWIEWMLDRWHASEPGLTEKSRDCGISWLAMAVSCWACIFLRGVAVGVGSAKADKVDRSDDPDCLFWKARYFMTHLPVEFRGGWDEAKDSSYMRLTWRRTSSGITGEAGDNIGVGGRKSWYLIDESSRLEHPNLVESSLLSTTNCRLDLTAITGMANVFAQKRHSGKFKVFTFSWRDDPRKQGDWYEREKARSIDPVAFAQNVDIDYMASSEGQVLPVKWVNACLDAHKKLNYVPSGIKRLGLDVADEGIDLCAAAGRYGSLLQELEAWSGKDSDTFRTAAKAVMLCDGRYDGIDYDADGLGAFVRGDINRINEDRTREGRPIILADPFRGSASGEGLHEPESEMVQERKNKDYFANLKAQSWWALRIRAYHTFRAVEFGDKFDPDNILCIPMELKGREELVMELAQPIYTINTAGKIIIDKTPDGMRSPNRADAVMIAFNPTAGALSIWSKL